VIRRAAIGVWVLLVTATPAVAAWDVDVDGRSRMTVDRYWTEGETAHIFRDGIDMTVSRGLVRRAVEVADAATRPVVTRVGTVPQAAPVLPRDPEELAAQRAAVDRHLLRVQQERFEAEARGDEPRRLKRLGREFHRTQERRRDLAHAAE
jgi:hypothetical protein